MSTDSTFATIVAGSFVLMLGAVVALFGYRLFWIILPIWGFFAMRSLQKHHYL